MQDKNLYKITTMKEIGKVIDLILNYKLPEFLKPKITGKDIEEFIEDIFKKNNILSIKNFCIDGTLIDCSVHICKNNSVAHGHPSRIIIEENDLIRIDLVGFKNGIYCDAARTYIIGNITNKEINLYNAAKQALINVMENVKIGDKLKKISEIISKTAKEFNVSIVKGLGGHYIGSKLHEYPFIPNDIKHQVADVFIKENDTLCIEPLFILEDDDIIFESDLTITTKKKHNIAVHFENTLYWPSKNKGLSISLTGNL